MQQIELYPEQMERGYYKVIKKKKRSKANLLIKFVLGLLALVSLFPFYQTLLISLSKEGDKFSQAVFLIPKNIDFSAYKYLLKEGKVIEGLKNTLFITAMGTLISMGV